MMRAMRLRWWRAALAAQELLFPGAGTGIFLAIDPVVVATARDIQRLAESLNGKVSFQRVDALEPLFGGSERMPNVFFKISRCWRTRSNSRRRAMTSELSSSVVVPRSGMVAGPYSLRQL